MEKQINLFLDFLSNDKKVSSNTLQSYKRDILQYQAYIDSNNLNYLKMDDEQIDTYLKSLSKANKKPSTISRNLATIRAFYVFLMRNKKIKKDPTVGVHSPKVEKKIPSVLTAEEVELLLEQPSSVDLKGIRDKAMLEFAYATGMRVTEIISLNIEDVNIKEGYVVCSSKNKKRNIPLGSISLTALNDYIEKSRPILIKTDEENALFVN